ncbi:MAG: hypothetical protein ACYCU3_09215 [Streptosporangiaceae bacterium]
MGGNTFRYQPERAAGWYWRRRFMVLLIGLAVFGAAAWGLSTALKVPAGATGPAGTGHGKPVGASPGASATGPTPRAQSSPRHPAATGTTGRRPRAAGTGHGGQGNGAVATSRPLSSPSRRPGKSSGQFQFKPAFCARSSIVLSVFSPQAGFAAGQAPTFSVNIVSTQPATCSFNVGSAHVALIVKEGSATIWNSSYCTDGAGSLITPLMRGVPTVVSMAWDRLTAEPGCSGRRRRVPAGTYTVTATDGSLASAPVTFRLG